MSGLQAALVRFFSIPEMPTPRIDNSVVSTLGRQNRYYPIQDESSFTLKQQLQFYAFYCIAWAIIAYLAYDPALVWAYAVGFLAGIVIMVIETWLYNNSTWVYLNNKDLRAYAFNAPGPVPDLRKGDTVPSGLDLRFSSGGEYKMLVENNGLPDNGRDGYVLPVDKYLEMSASGKIRGMDLSEFLSGDFKGHVGFGKQREPVFFSSKTMEISNTCFYISILCLTLALYINRTKWQGPNHLVWVLGSIVAALTGMGIAVSGNDVASLFDMLYIKRRFMIAACTFAITAILVSGQR